MAIAMMNLMASSAFAVWINEIHYDNVSTDVDEFVEVAGIAGTDLTGWMIVLYNGGDGGTYGTISLGGTIDDEGAGFGALGFYRSGLQNGGPDGLALLDATSTVVQLLSYEGEFAATEGAAAGLISADVGVAETTSTPLGASLQLTGIGNVYSDFGWVGPLPSSFGSLNSAQSLTQSEDEPISGSGQPAGVPEAGASLVLLALSWAGITLLNGARLKEVG